MLGLENNICNISLWNDITPINPVQNISTNYAVILYELEVGNSKKLWTLSIPKKKTGFKWFTGHDAAKVNKKF